MSRPLVIVTRPPEDAPPLVEALDGIGCDALLAPMIEIAPAEPRPEIALDGVQAFLITSANGVRALAAALGAAPAGRRIPVLAVGEASAASAKQAEFEIVEAAGGDIDALAALVAQRCDPAHGRLVHAAGRTVAGDLKGALEAKGFAVDRLVLYEAVPVAALPPEAADALDDERCFGVLFFSPRTAETFVTLIRQAGLGEQAAHLAAVCLSGAVAEAARALSWKRTVVAARPEQAALIEALRDALEAEAPTAAPSAAEAAAAERAGGMAEPEQRPGEGEGEPAEAAAPAMRRRHFSWLVGAVVLAAIGGGLYLAWPEIVGEPEPPAPEAEAPAVEAEPAPQRADVQPAPEAEAPQPPEVPTEAPAPAEPATAEPKPAEQETAAPEPAEPAKPAAPAPEEAATAAPEAPPAEAEAQPAAPTEPAAEPAGLAALKERLDKLERQSAAQAGDGSVVRDAELAARLATLESRLSASESAMREAAGLRKQLGDLEAEATALTRRLASLERESREALRLVALVETKAALGAAAREGAALDHELKDLRALLPEGAPLGEPLATLARFNEQGAPTYGNLRTRFPALAREIVKAEAEPGEDAGWVDQTIARLENIVTVRKKGGALDPASVDARLVRAERALAESDGAAALDALKDLKGGAALSAFREDLSRRVALDAAVRAVDRYVTGLAAARIVPPAAEGPL